MYSLSPLSPQFRTVSRGHPSLVSLLYANRQIRPADFVSHSSNYLNTVHILKLDFAQTHDIIIGTAQIFLPNTEDEFLVPDWGI
jgi:hypothetical protein